MKRILKCVGCGKEVKVDNYGIKIKKSRKSLAFSSPYDDNMYRCSVCRGINTPKKSKKVKVENEDKTRGNSSK